MKTLGILAVMLIAVTALRAHDDSQSPNDVVRLFYESVRNPQPDLGRDLDRLSPLLTVHLNGLLEQARTADAQYTNRFPQDAPPFEHGTCVLYGGGDCDFSSYSVLANKRRGATAQVTVELSLKDNNRPSQPPYRWRNTVMLKTERGRWVIDDIRYFDGGASETLVAIVKDAQGLGK
jgi:hypothetical protein